jgi:hypothetical protein
MNHLIKRQIISLTLATERGAFQLQHRISQLHQAEILLVLQRVLDEMSSEGEVIYIDRLEIDLGSLPLKQIMEAGWVQLLEEGIRRQLHEMLDAREGGEGIVRRTERSGVFDQWLFSMERGYLPWNAGRTDEDWYLKVLEAIATDHHIAERLRSELARDTIVLQRVVQQHSALFLVPLTEALTAEKQDRLAPAIEELWMMVRGLEQEGWPAASLTCRIVTVTAWKYILRSFSASALSPREAVSLRTEALLIRMVRAFFSPRQVQALLRSGGTGWPLLLPACRQSIAVTGQEGWLIDDLYLISDIPSRERPAATFLPISNDPARPPKAASGGIDTGAGEVQAGSWAPGESQEKIPRKEASDDGTKDETIAPLRDSRSAAGEAPASGGGLFAPGDVRPPGSSGDVLSNTGEVSGARATPQQGGGAPVSRDAIEVLAGEEVFVGNAGVILLHPFLHSIFKLLGYTEGGKFRTAELHARALYLIHYLATGETSAHEHELLIAKLLCAWPLDEPVDGEVELGPEELAEAGDLLTAAIAQWEKVKNTSHGGMREGFLRRPGKLQVKGQDLHLLVETSSIDMLLDYLPWNLSIIKLPWMKNILRVEWR